MPSDNPDTYVHTYQILATYEESMAWRNYKAHLVGYQLRILAKSSHIHTQYVHWLLCALASVAFRTEDRGFESPPWCTLLEIYSLIAFVCLLCI
jgi:hypothetical protein